MDKGITNNDLVPIDFDPFAGPEIIRVVPAIEPQLEIWASCIIGGEDANRAFNESVSLLLKGEFNHAAMESALHDVMQRHDALRSSFSADGKQICIYKELPLQIFFEDFSKESSEDQQSCITEFSKKDAETSFDLLNGPLFRVALFKLGEKEHYLTITAHHIICDGWSLGIVMQDLSKLYSAYVKKQMPDLPPAYQFGNYAVQQLAFVQSPEYKKIEEYWVDQYKQSIPVLDIPTDYPRPVDRTYKSHRDDYPLNQELVSAIKKMGAKSGCSLVTTLMVSYEVFLHLLTGQDDIVLGIPTAGQSATDNYALVGHCVNLLPLRSNPKGGMPFFEYLKQRKSKILNDYDHQQFTFGSLLKMLNITRDSSRVPLVPLVFNIDMGLDDGVAFEGLKHKLLYNPREYESFEIFINASGSEQSLVLEWSYNTQLFKPATIRRMMNEFEFMLQSIVNEPAIKIKDIPLKPLSEIYAKLKLWNDTASDYPKEKVFQDLFYDAVNEYRENTALRFNDQIFSYKNLNETSNQLAALLSDQNVRPGDIVGLAVDRSPEMIIALLAIMKSGAAYVPIDPLYPQKRIEFMLQASSAKILITSNKYKGQFQSAANELLIEDILPRLSSYPKENIKAKINSNSLAYILYTSGSTGDPKGVQIEHHSLVNFLLSMQKKPGINNRDSLLAITTISFDIAGLELYLPLISGAAVVLADAESAKDGRILLEIIESQNITMMQATPSTWRMMIEAGWERKLPIKILCGGEALPKDLADKLVARCGSLWNMYGPTETTIWSAAKQIIADDETITIGRPIDNTQIYILDDYLKSLPEGSVGEIYIGGDGVARGYLNRSDLTNERFVDNPYPELSEGKIYRTGDLGKFVEGGEVQCLGRIDHQVKIRGYRIELGEIEQALIKQEGIKEAVVIALQERLVAYVVPDGSGVQATSITDEYNEDLQIQQLETWKHGIKDLLPEYMLPRDFVFLKTLPLTPNGKIDRNALPKPTQNTEGRIKKYVAPKTETEKLIANIWSQLLGIGEVGIYDDFFELGGHSLIAAQVMGQLEKETGRRLPLTTLFKFPVLEQLASLFEDVKPDEINSLPINDIEEEPIDEREIIPLPATEPQKEIWISCMIGGEDANRSYNISMSERLHGKLDRAAMDKAIYELVNRHESLRSTFSEDGREMCIHKKREVDIYFEDISGQGKEQQKWFIDDFSIKNAETSFDLLNGPLCRFALFKLGDGEHYLTLTAHHIICDGWSLGVLMQDLSKLYSAHAKGLMPILPRAPRFSKYSAEQLEFAASEEYKEVEQYWIDQYKQGAPVMDIPTDYPRPTDRTYKSHRDDYPLDPNLVSALKKMGASAGCSLITTLIGAYEVYLHRITGQDDIVLGLPAAGQSITPSYYGLVGHCVNLLPLRSNPQGELPFVEYLKERRSKVLDDYDHQRFTFGSLLKKLNITRDASRVPLVPLVFNIEVGMDDGVAFHGLKHEMVFNPREYETFEIFLNTGGSEESPTLQWSYNTQLFKATTIKRMMTELVSLLQAVVKDPLIKIKNIPLLSQSELSARLTAWNNTAFDYPKEIPLQRLISKVAVQHANKTAISFGKQSMSYKSVDETSNQLAALLLQNYHLRRGDIIAVAIDRSAEMVIALLAILKSGAAYIPLDPEYPEERVRFMLDDSSAKVLITSKKYKGHFQTGATELLIENAWKELSNYSKETPNVQVAGNDLAYVLYTSGSTGRPKGVQIEHHSLVNFLLSMQKKPGIKPGDSLLAVTTISFDIAGLELYLPLISGAELVIADSESAKDGRILLEIIENQNISMMQATPSTWRMIIGAGWERKLSIKILCGGEALPKDLADKLVARCSSLWNMYGPTETTIWSAAKQITADDDIITIGQPIGNTQIYILDSYGNSLPEGSVGEIYIGGDGVARGYLNRPDLTIEKFVDNPFPQFSKGKMYRTGDLGKFIEGGEIECLGRIDHQVKVRGYRIELGEIEHILNKQDNIKEAVVIAREDRPGDQRLVAYVVLTDSDKEFSGNELVQEWRTTLRNLLPLYMVPNDFVVLPQFPLTLNSKIDRKLLPQPKFSSDANTKIAPKNDVEKMIANIWAEQLGVNDVGIYDDFFELGGHSLIAAQVMARLEKETGKRLPLTTLFKFPVFEQFASLFQNGNADLENPHTTDTSEEMAVDEQETIVIPAIEPQIEIWVSCMIGGEDANRSYNISMSQRLQGQLDRTAMERAMQALVERHESLRSTFSEDGRDMCIHKKRNANIYFEDLLSQSSEQQKFFINEFSKKSAEEPFDLLTGPLFRMSLLKLAEKEYYLTITVHHIICDGWSLSVLMQDLAKFYSAYTKGEKPDLEDAPQYRHYASEQNAFYESERYKATLQYWVGQYKDQVPVVDLPTDYIRPANRTYKSHRDDYALSQELVSAIKKVGTKAGCSLTITLRAAFEIFLYLLTGQDDIVLGLPAAGQSSSPSFYGLVGHCVNLLPLRSQFNQQSTFIEYLKERKIAILDGYDHQELTFGSLLKTLNIARDKSRVPLVPVVFNYIEMGMDDGVVFYGLDHEMVFNPREYETFEIFLNTGGSEESPTLQWSYNTQLFKADSIRRMMSELVSLLETVVKDPLVKIKDISLKPTDEIYTKLKIWNDTASDYPKQITFQDLFFEAANKHAKKTALRFGQQMFTYKNLNDTSNQLAALLLDQNIKPGDIVALAVDRSPEMLITLLAIMKTGAAYVPIDPLYPQKRIEFMLQDSCAKILITSKKYKDRFRSAAKELLIENIWGKLSSYPKKDIKTNINGSGLAYILYTSGSTGNPKGVQIEHHSLVNFLLSMQKKPGMEPGDSLLAITTISFDIAGLELYLPLISGAELVLANTESSKDGRVLLDMIELQNISMMQATPSTWRMMIEAGWEKKLPLKILCGGEALPKDLADKLVARSSSLWNMYGPTETTIWSAIKHITANDEMITIGRPIDNTQLFILDDYLKPLPEGSVGEIYIGGDGVARGYLNRSDLTNERFVDNPFDDFSGNKIYRTGDLGKFIEDGELQCLGRIDHQVKIHGYRIELEEIEQALIKQKGIKESVVVAHEERLVAYIVPDSTALQINITDNNEYKEDAQVKQQLAKWKQDIKELLPEYMLPKDFVLLKKLPLTPNGKIDRNALPKPTQNSEAQNKKYVAPKTDTEKLIAGIWAKLLGRKEVSTQDDFFEIGGHSLIAVQAMTSLEKITGKRMPLASLFEAPTVEKLAQLVELNDRPKNFDSLVAIKPKGDKMPLYIVHGFGMNVLLFNNVARNMDVQQPVYALQAKGLNADKLDDSFDTMEDIAAYYVSEILLQNPDGPYALAGYSLGGIIVFEMAKQLKKMGKEIKMLAMFDTYADNSNYFNPFLLNVTKKFRRQFPKMIFILRSLIRQPWQTILYQTEFVKSKFRQLFRLRARNEDEGPSYDDKLAAKYEYAYVNYKMTPYDGPIDLFKVKTRLYYLDDLIYLGWKQFAEKGVNVYEISGDHKTFLYPPFDKDFARVLQQALDERTSTKETGKNSLQEKHKLKAI